MTAPLDELAVGRASRRLDEIASEHPELAAGGAPGPENAAAWLDVLEADAKGPDDMQQREKTIQVAFRLPASLVKRLDKHVERMADEHPGLDFNRADAVRSLLTRVLDEVEGTKRSKRG